MIVKFLKVTKLREDEYEIETDKGVLIYRGVLHDGMEGKEVDATWESELNIMERKKYLVLTDYSFKPDPDSKEAVQMKELQQEEPSEEEKTATKKRQQQELEVAFLRDILVSPRLAKVKGDPVKAATKWATAYAKWVLREGK